MTATRIVLAPEHDRYAALPVPQQHGSYQLVDAGPFELDDKPGLHVLVRCSCGKQRYAPRTPWLRGTWPIRKCVKCARQANSEQRRKFTAFSRVPWEPKIEPVRR